MQIKGRFEVKDLAVINVVGGEADEGVGVAVCDRMSEHLYACDFDGTTDDRGADEGWNCLILAEDLSAWKEEAALFGAEVAVATGPVTPGHYGDGDWPGVDLCESPRGELYWIEL